MIFIPTEEYNKIQAVLPILCVDCLIVHDNKCLLLRRTNEPAKGQYWFPGGRVLKGEVIRDAALRKAREEVSLECVFEKVITIEETIFEQKGSMPCTIHTVNVCCKLSTNTLNNFCIDKFHDDYLWVNLEQAKQLDLHAAVLAPILKCLQPL